jgi:hypothetical protein
MYFYITVLNVSIIANITPTAIRKTIPSHVFPNECFAFSRHLNFLFRTYPANVSFPVPSASYKSDLPHAQSCHLFCHTCYSPKARSPHSFTKTQFCRCQPSDFNCPQLRLRTLRMLRRAVWFRGTNLLKDPATFICRLEQYTNKYYNCSASPGTESALSPKLGTHVQKYTASHNLTP